MTHTLKTLLDMPLDELRVLVAELDPDFTKCPRCSDPECAYNVLPDIRDLNYWKTKEDGLTDEEYDKFQRHLRYLAAKEVHKRKLSNIHLCRNTTSATAHHRAVAWVATKLKL